ncbi:hypothetical protein EIP86_000124 [Pleurotus ostreatoroseus]|nr:hypothetical protein EIP86_000124 [Pleurotus ostreatoroseus]
MSLEEYKQSIHDVFATTTNQNRQGQIAQQSLEAYILDLLSVSRYYGYPSTTDEIDSLAGLCQRHGSGMVSAVMLTLNNGRARLAELQDTNEQLKKKIETLQTGTEQRSAE